MKFFNYKKYTYLFFPIIFTLPVVIFGINDVEEYMLGTFSTLIFWENLPTSLFTFFYDFYGPGTKIPIGSGPLFHPLNPCLSENVLASFEANFVSFMFITSISKYFFIKSRSALA